MIRILCSGDLHLGRRSSRLSDGADARAHSATAAWNALVELALTERVQLVALSGDLVDRENRYFEAFGPLERGVARLAAAGIHVIAVAGNHDFDVLPRLVPSLGKTFHLLGAGGTWTGLSVPGPGGAAALRVVGWSFPTEHVAASPMAGFPALPKDDVPVLGLVHGDLDAPATRYAPLSAAEMRAKSVSFWLLGHIHTPRLHQQSGATRWRWTSPAWRRRRSWTGAWPRASARTCSPWWRRDAGRCATWSAASASPAARRCIDPSNRVSGRTPATCRRSTARCGRGWTRWYPPRARGPT
jgi:predicted phosphodiesterase